MKFRKKEVLISIKSKSVKISFKKNLKINSKMDEEPVERIKDMRCHWLKPVRSLAAALWTRWRWDRNFCLKKITKSKCNMTKKRCKTKQTKDRDLTKEKRLLLSVMSGDREEEPVMTKISMN